MANISSINGNPIVVGASGIEDFAVTEDKLAEGSVTIDKLSDDLTDALKSKQLDSIVPSTVDFMSDVDLTQSYSSGSTTTYAVLVTKRFPLEANTAINVFARVLQPLVHPEWHYYSNLRMYYFADESSSSLGNINVSFENDGLTQIRHTNIDAHYARIAIILSPTTGTTVEEAYTEIVHVDYFHVFLPSGQKAPSDLLAIKDYDMAASATATLLGYREVCHRGFSKGYQSINASSTTIYAFNAYDKISFSCHSGDIAHIEVRGYRIYAGDSDKCAYMGFRLYAYASDETLIKSFNIAVRSGSISRSIVLPDGTVSCRLAFMYQAKSGQAAHSVTLSFDMLSVSIGMPAQKWCRQSDYDALTTRSNIPSYYFDMTDDESFDAGPYLEQRIKDVPQGTHILFCTDQHWPNDRNTQHSINLMSYVAHRLGGAKVLYGGDVLNEDATGYAGYGHLCDFFSLSVAAFGADLMPCVGNHDINLANVEPSRFDTESEYEAAYERRVIPWDAAKRAILGHLNDIIIPYDVTQKLTGYSFTSDEKKELLAAFACNYYYDDNANGVRYIVYSLGQPTNVVTRLLFNGSSTQDFSSGQLIHNILVTDWLYDVLMGTPDDYHVVMVSHVARKAEATSSVAELLWGRMLYAAKTNGVCSFTFKVDTNGWTSGVPEGDSWRYTYDFSNGPDLRRVLLLGGHFHVDYIDMASPDGIIRQEPYPSSLANTFDNVVMYSQSCDAWRNIAREDHYFPGQNWVERTNETVTEQCVTVITITEDDNVYFTRIGGGNDVVARA